MPNNKNILREKINEKAEIIADLYELKMSLARPLDYGRMVIEPNTTYTVIEMLISLLMDKHKIDYEEVKAELFYRSTIKNN